eukprot:584872-Prymnesium_polylepis.1
MDASKYLLEREVVFAYGLSAAEAAPLALAPMPHAGWEQGSSDFFPHVEHTQPAGNASQIPPWLTPEQYWLIVALNRLDIELLRRARGMLQLRLNWPMAGFELPRSNLPRWVGAPCHR